TITIISPTSGRVTNSLTWQNIRVRPVAGTPLALGNIFKTGTSSILGVANNVTSLGALKEVPGAKTQLGYIAQPSPSVTVDSNFSITPLIAVQDKFGNTVISENSSAINLIAVLSTQSCAGTAGAGQLTANPASGTPVINGIKSYESMKYSFGEIIKICASSPGLSSALSNAVTVNNLIPAITSIAPESKIAGGEEFIMTVSGADFISASVVNFAGSPRNTTFISKTQLTAKILSSDLLATGRIAITVKNPAPGGGISNSKNFTVKNVTSQFTMDDPGDMTINTRLGYSVTRKDKLGNIVIYGTDTVYLYSDSTGLNKAFYDSKTAEKPVASVVIPESSFSADFWYLDDILGKKKITVSDNPNNPDGPAGLADAEDTAEVNIIPINATRLTIINPEDTTASSVAKIIIKAQDNNGKTDTNFNGFVLLTASGSALGSGLVAIANGIGTASILDNIPETVRLSLVDVKSTNLDVSSTQDIVFNSCLNVSVSCGQTETISPAPFANFSGSAMLNSKINLYIFPNGNLNQGVFFKQYATSLNGTFAISLADLRARSTMYALILTDRNDTAVKTKFFAGSLSSNVSFENIIFAPALNLKANSIKQGDLLFANGYAQPQALIEFAIDGAPISERVIADVNGFYSLNIGTANLSLAKHLISAKQTALAQASDFSEQKSFAVSKLLNPAADLNKDGVLGNPDIDIFISRWLSINLQVKLLDDFNGDGKNDSKDIELFAQYYVGG
ncbi:MAG: IPT/TIG domain-containing protein, partial [Patescibacteria group bacterium]